MQFLYAFLGVLIFVVVVIIAINIDILVKKLSIIEDQIERIATALEKLIQPDE